MDRKKLDAIVSQTSSPFSSRSSSRRPTAPKHALYILYSTLQAQLLKKENSQVAETLVFLSGKNIQIPDQRSRHRGQREPRYSLGIRPPTQSLMISGIVPSIRVDLQGRNMPQYQVALVWSTRYVCTEYCKIEKQRFVFG